MLRSFGAIARFAVVVAIAVIGLGNHAFAELRTWTLNGIEYDGELVSFDPEKGVTLKLDSGKEGTLPLSALGDGDRTFVLRNYAADAVVRVAIENYKGVREINDNGFFIAPDLVLMPYEFTQGAQSIVLVHRDNSISKPIELAHIDHWKRVAILRIENPKKDQPYLKWRFDEELEIGTDIWSIGHPNGLVDTIKMGKIESYETNVPLNAESTFCFPAGDTTSYYATKITYGSEQIGDGNPILDSNGWVIGVIVLEREPPYLSGFQGMDRYKTSIEAVKKGKGNKEALYSGPNEISHHFNEWPHPILYKLNREYSYKLRKAYAIPPAPPSRMLFDKPQKPKKSARTIAIHKTADDFIIKLDQFANSHHGTNKWLQLQLRYRAFETEVVTFPTNYPVHMKPFADQLAKDFPDASWVSKHISKMGNQDYPAFDTLIFYLFEKRNEFGYANMIPSATMEYSSTRLNYWWEAKVPCDLKRLRALLEEAYKENTKLIDKILADPTGPEDQKEAIKRDKIYRSNQYKGVHALTDAPVTTWVDPSGETVDLLRGKSVFLYFHDQAQFTNRHHMAFKEDDVYDFHAVHCGPKVASHPFSRHLDKYDNTNLILDGENGPLGNGFKVNTDDLPLLICLNPKGEYILRIRGDFSKGRPLYRIRDLVKSHHIKSTTRDKAEAKVARLERLPTLPEGKGIARGLRLHYDFEFSDATGVVKDLSPRQNDAMRINDVEVLPGKFGKALKVTKRGGVAVCKSPDLFAQDWEGITIACWVKPEGECNGAHVVQQVLKGSVRNYSLSVGSLIDRKPTYSHMTYKVTGHSSIKQNHVPIDKWTHMVGTVKDKRITLYFNGQKDRSAGPSHSQPYEFSEELLTSIGTYRPINNNPGAVFIGMVDEVKIWNRALSKEEVESLYGSYKATKKN